MEKLKKLVVHLSLIDGIGPATIRQIVCGAECDPGEFYRFSVTDFVELAKISPRLADLCVKGLKNNKIFEDEIKQLRGSRIVTIFDSEYPNLLKTIHVPPVALWVRGNLADAFRVAVVGSRRNDGYARRSLKYIVPDLVKAGYEIVSGGAIGVDGLAHRMALDFGGRTVAVLGSGLLRPYPSSNTGLFRDIVDSGGAIISPFPLNTAPVPGNFPVRNRIIAGISSVCLVVQAAEKSGALITAAHALEEGRDVWAVPGEIDNPLSVGVNRLIRDGAGVALSGRDIVQSCEGGMVGSGIVLKEYDGLEQKIISELHRPCSLDELQSVLEMSGPELVDLLFRMQLDGVVRQNFAGTWERSD